MILIKRYIVNFLTHINWWLLAHMTKMKRKALLSPNKEIIWVKQSVCFRWWQCSLKCQMSFTDARFLDIINCCHLGDPIYGHSENIGIVYLELLETGNNFDSICVTTSHLQYCCRCIATHFSDTYTEELTNVSYDIDSMWCLHSKGFWKR